MRKIVGDLGGVLAGFLPVGARLLSEQIYRIVDDVCQFLSHHRIHYIDTNDGAVMVVDIDRSGRRPRFSL